MSDKYVVAAGRSVIAIKGVVGPGEEIAEKDLATPENFKKLVASNKIVKSGSFIDNEDAKFKAPEIKKDKKEAKETKKQANIGTVTNSTGKGAQKK